MSWLVESVKRETKGPKTSSGQRQVNSRLFMDDIQTTTETVPQTKHLLGKLNEKMKWAGLDFRFHACCPKSQSVLLFYLFYFQGITSLTLIYFHTVL